MDEIIGWVLYILCIVYFILIIMVPTYLAAKIPRMAANSIAPPFLVFSAFSINIIFAFIKYSKFNLIWIIPICIMN